MSGAASPAEVARGTKVLLCLAALAVGLAAADTYVVVLALPDMMASTGIPVEQMQRATPIISSFLLGYVAAMPLIGQLADLQGRVPVLILALVVFAGGSLLTVLAYDVNSMVVGRFLQGVGGGGLVPVTLALVSDLYPLGQRSVPLGIVSGVHEVAQVCGPVLGGVVLTFADWRAIFALNLAVALVLGAALRAQTFRAAIGHPRAPALSHRRRGGSPDVLGAGLGLLALVAATLVVLRPAEIMRDSFWGQMLLPLLGDGRWLSPLGVTAMAASVFFVVRLLLAPRPLIDVRPWLRAALAADLTGSALLTVTLGGVVLAFTTADLTTRRLAIDGQWYLFGAALGATCLVIHLRRSAHPLVPPGALRRLQARAALLVSFLLGAALISALVHIPLFARSTLHGDSPLMATLTFLQFLVALPIGAWVAGRLTRWWGPGPSAALGMVVAAGSFASMSQWQPTALGHWSSSVTLVLCGLGFGLALTPVNAAVLASTDASLHNLSSALVVFARTVGMLVGLAILASSAQQNSVFAAAAVVSLTAALAAMVMFRTATPAQTGTTAGLG